MPEYDGKIEEAFNKWLVYERFGDTGFKTEQAVKTRFALEHNELVMTVNEVGISYLLRRAGIEEEKAGKISDGLLGGYIIALIEEHSIRAFEDGFKLAAHLLST